jgi:hypothetical protein
MGYTCIGSEEYQRLLCMICYEVLKNKGIKPINLRRNFETEHSNGANKLLEFFQRELKE